jgi:hypothetical protein
LVCSLGGKIRTLVQLVEKDEHMIQRVNFISKTENEIVAMAEKIDERIIQETLDEITVDAVRSMMQERLECREERLDLIHYHIMEEKMRVKKEWNKRRANQMRELHSDEPSKAFK